MTAGPPTSGAGGRRLLDTTSPIEGEPLPPETVMDGHPRAGTRALATLAGAEIGVWELTEGTVTDVEVDEVFVVLSGSGSVVFDDDREEICLAPGVTVQLRAGDRTTWTVNATLRKVYVAQA